MSVDDRSTLEIVEHRQYPKSILVWGGICASDKTCLGFLEEGVEINQNVYQMHILEVVILPWTQKQLGNANWTFHQDSTLAYNIKKSQEWGKVNFPDMISSKEWPPYTPYSILTDYSVRSIL
ncbi:DDE_3 domain-containing protein [Trichonephila clavipes]|nr:DDE_3 domain-containing protein [Trichonephila clavipes]